jgi:hypothetical protein
VGVPGVECVPLIHDYPGWWAKIEALRPGYAEGRAIYLDLDTLPVGDMTRLASYDGEFAMIRDLGRPKLMQSGVMAFRAGTGAYVADLYDAFCERADAWVAAYRGDGEWLHAHADAPDALQDTEPGICSLKWQARYEPPPDAVLICGHGRPRLSDPLAGWAHTLWNRRAK